MTPTNLRDQLLRDEGMRTLPYTDSVGKLTIGVGRNLTDCGISEEEAMQMLENDIDAVHWNVTNEFPWAQALDPVRLAALENMAFNLGIAGLSKFQKFLLAMMQGKWQTAAYELKNSKWAGQVGPRAERLEQQILTGEWQ